MADVAVEVVLALPGQCVLRRVLVAEGSTVAEAISAAQLGDQDSVATRVGIFGRRVDLSERLRDGDRVEIYRALVMDPKDARRRRVRDR